MQDWFSDKRYLALLVLIAVLIIAVGNWLRPPRQATELIISEAERLSLQFLSQQRNVQDISSHFGRVAGRLGVHLVRLKEPSTSGLVWQGNRVIVPGLPKNHSANFTLRSENSEQPASPFLVVPELPISLLDSRSSRGFKAVSGTAAGAPKSGMWVLLMSRNEEGSTSYSPGFFSTTSTAQCGDHLVKELVTSVPLETSNLGAGLFDLEGHFLGMVLQCGPRLAAVSVDTIYAWVQMANRPSEKLLQNYGIRLLSLDSHTSAFFQHSEGALISEVWKGSTADSGGLIPGDIIVSWNTVPVQKPDDLNALQPNSQGEVSIIEIIRGRRLLKMTVETVSGGWWSRTGPTEELGLRMEPPDTGFRIEYTKPGSPAQLAGLRAGDRVTLIDARAVSHLQAHRALDTATVEKPIYVVVSREEKTIGVLLP